MKYYRLLNYLMNKSQLKHYNYYLFIKYQDKIYNIPKTKYAISSLKIVFFFR